MVDPGKKILDELGVWNYKLMLPPAGVAIQQLPAMLQRTFCLSSYFLYFLFRCACCKNVTLPLKWASNCFSSSKLVCIWQTEILCCRFQRVFDFGKGSVAFFRLTSSLSDMHCIHRRLIRQTTAADEKSGALRYYTYQSAVLNSVCPLAE